MQVAVGDLEVFTSPISREGGKLATIFADLQRLAGGFGSGQAEQVSVQLHGEGHLILGKAVVRARPVLNYPCKYNLLPHTENFQQQNPGRLELLRSGSHSTALLQL